MYYEISIYNNISIIIIIHYIIYLIHGNFHDV